MSWDIILKCRVTTPPFQQAGSADGVMIHPFTFPGGLYNTFGLVRYLRAHVAYDLDLRQLQHQQPG